MRYLCFLFLLLPAFALPDEKQADDPHVMKPGDAPTPYTAEEIRKAFPVGRTDVIKIESGEQVITSTFKVVKCDEKGSEVERVQVMDGKEAPAMRGTSTWKEMQAHASFPKASTKITEETIEVPAGKFECLVYVVNRMTTKCTMYFAKKLPGPPVKMVTETDGKVDSTMTLMEHKEPEKPAEGEKPAGN